MLSSAAWAFITLGATIAQTFRNVVQRQLTVPIGMMGATYVRFVFGFPFALALLGAVLWAEHAAPPAITPPILAVLALGGVAQIAATALMLASMREKSFVVSIAYTKTEPVQVALFSVMFLGERLSLSLVAAIFLATAGVLAMSWPRAAERGAALVRPAAFGLVSAAFFALSAVLFRQGILLLGAQTPLVSAATGLAISLAIQSAVILVYAAAFDQASLAGMRRAWRPALLAGLLGALASQGWFLAFALTTATKVRTLAVVEVLFAQIVSQRVFRQRASPREVIGVGLVVAGIVVLLCG